MYTYTIEIERTVTERVHVQFNAKGKEDATRVADATINCLVSGMTISAGPNQELEWVRTSTTYHHNGVK